MTVYFDNFRRANGNLDGSTSSDSLFTWDEPSGTEWEVVGNTAQAVDIVADTFSVAVGLQPTVGDDQFVHARCTSFARGGSQRLHFEIGCRINSAGNQGYAVQVGVDSAGTPDNRLYKMDDDSNLDTDTSVNAAGGGLLSLEVEGTSIRAYWNGVLFLEGTDSEFSGSSNRLASLHCYASGGSTSDLVIQHFTYGDLDDVHLVDYRQSNFTDNSDNDEVTPVVPWRSGDTLIVKASLPDTVDGGGNTSSLGTPTATGLTFAEEAEVNEGTGPDGDDTVVYIWSAVAASDGSSAITSVTTNCGTSNEIGIVAEVWRNVDEIGTPVELDNSSATVIAVTMTKPGAASVVLSDWNAVGDSAVTPNPASGGSLDHISVPTGESDNYHCFFQNLSAGGPTNYGVGSHAGGVDMSGIAIPLYAAAESSVAVTAWLRG